jgi:hypothetical protein
LDKFSIFIAFSLILLVSFDLNDIRELRNLVSCSPVALRKGKKTLQKVHFQL